MNVCRTNSGACARCFSLSIPWVENSGDTGMRKRRGARGERQISKVSDESPARPASWDSSRGCLGAKVVPTGCKITVSLASGMERGCHGVGWSQERTLGTSRARFCAHRCTPRSALESSWFPRANQRLAPCERFLHGGPLGEVGPNNSQMCNSLPITE